MPVPVLEYYRAKPELTPDDLQWLAVYVRPGELDFYFEAAQWILVGRTFHPNKFQVRDVELRGYCLRPSRKSKYDA